ncbi:MAG: IS3 family transposase, partial [Bacteroidota bacterium]
MTYSLNALYKVVVISKQAVSQYRKRRAVFEEQLQGLLLEVEELRKEHPGCGVEKMYYTLQPTFIGWDRFIELEYGLKRKKSYKRTTSSGVLYYPNLIEGLAVCVPHTLWQSDITYIALSNKCYYAVFIIDVYTKKIVGYSLTDHLRAVANVQALKKALKTHPAPKIHHSDRASQYTYKPYVILLKKRGFKISMARMPQENAYDERVNRTIKEEYLHHWQPQSWQHLRKMIAKAIEHYNTKRIHLELNRKTPVAFERNFSMMASHHRKTITIFIYKSK